MIENDLLQGAVNDGVIQIAGLRSLLMSSGSGIGFGVKTLDGSYRVANPVLERLLHQKPGQVLGKSESELLPSAVLATLGPCDQQLLEGAAGTSEEVDLAVDAQPVRYLWLKLPVFDPGGKLQAIASLVYPYVAEQAPTAVQQTLDHLQQTNQQLQQTLVELEQVASTDKLTGIWNRRRLEDCVRREMERFQRYKHPLSLLVIDVDFFKTINDRYGHGTGDRVLQLLSTQLQDGLRGADSLARWGGEEFVILCPDTNKATATTLAERLRAQVANASFPEIGRLTISIAVAECEADESWAEWFQRADEALYRAKAEGRNRVHLAPGTGGHLAAEDGRVANFVHLVWRSAYECGNEDIDRGHRQLFSDANDLLAAILSEHGAESVNATVDKLLTDIRAHFAEEESVFVAAGFPDAAAHIAMHQQLIARALSMGDDYRAGKQSLGDVFQFLAHEVIAKHLLGADRKFFDHLQRKVSPAG
ncbi:MAG: putative diguanylate cyclase YdaM [Candidatus Accumulibacter appositus]|uniref:diguanylate cyclase n=1 Tax=Candidatus Accumulibacter appositus TaxID=1454003 RepID=A0A011NZ42_9PROT|nr:diguanylate cyclase [Accumulibacter sp.]EXI80611.1 MAG: putative diguanylate cyclase YdaM [Candidatus Accumulibacter appositus]HRF05608.1 diguanylate cyclase [Accumulibacter sp.]